MVSSHRLWRRRQHRITVEGIEQELGAFHGWLRNLTNTISNIVTRPNREEVERRIYRNFGEDGESNVSIQHDRESHLFLLSAVYRVISAVLLLAEVTMVVG